MGKLGGRECESPSIARLQLLFLRDVTRASATARANRNAHQRSDLTWAHC